jgi:hypothetical protein
MSPMNGYESAWKTYRGLRRNLILLWLLYVPSVVMVALFSNSLFRTTMPAMVLAVLWMVAFLIANMHFEQFLCPRCGNRFDKRAGAFAPRMWLFARKCQNCSLEKFGDSNSE